MTPLLILTMGKWYKYFTTHGSWLYFQPISLNSKNSMIKYANCIENGKLLQHVPITEYKVWRECVDIDNYDMKYIIDPLVEEIIPKPIKYDIWN